MGIKFNYDEGQTPLDENEKEGLKISTIETQAELDEFEQLNIEKAVMWSIDKKLKKEQLLTEQFIKSFHKRMYGDVWKWAGQFRKSDRNIGVGWKRIGMELKYLLDDANFWIDKETYPPDEVAIRFKHRLVSIHCFPNGNGRHSRLIADLLIEKIYNREVYTWSSGTRMKADEARKKYISALREADNGSILPLIDFARS